jgi:hypothetical protein
LIMIDHRRLHSGQSNSDRRLSDECFCSDAQFKAPVVHSRLPPAHP